LENNCLYTHSFYDALIFNKIKQVLGGHVRLLSTGSAPISRDVSNFFKVAFCVPILEGYGQTETGGAVCLSHRDDPRTQHIGGPIGSCKIRLRDVPEMGYLATDKPPRGEIQFFGPCVFKGYFKNPEKTAEAFDEDGWLCSGDVGAIYENGSI
jgi:long-chain acyl-CoA synthetase